MIYDQLATYYDALVKNDEATQTYVEFIQMHTNGFEVMELACGSGEISLSLAKLGYHLDASDISTQMLDVAKAKDTSLLVHYEQMDMRQLESKKKYDAILCFCDSLNYLEFSDLPKLFHDAYQTLKSDGTFIFDMHSQDRLKEFEEEFYEAGNIEGVDYVWSILSEDQSLYHNFVFYDEELHPHYENHVQHVFHPRDVLEELQKVGFHVSVYTDFHQSGIVEGEKYFYVCKKENT